MKSNNLNNSTSRNNYNLNKYLLPAVLLKDLYDGSLILEDTHLEYLTKNFFFRKAGLLFDGKEKFLTLLGVVHFHSKPQMCTS